MLYCDRAFSGTNILSESSGDMTLKQGSVQSHSQRIGGGDA